jgi:hypothetical protein
MAEIKIRMVVAISRYMRISQHLNGYRQANAWAHSGMLNESQIRLFT